LKTAFGVDNPRVKGRAFQRVKTLQDVLGLIEVWVSDLVFGSRLDPCHDLLEFVGQLETGSH